MRADHTIVLSVEGIRDALPSHGTLQIGYLKGLQELMRTRGRDLAAVLERCDLDARTFDDPSNNIECGAAVEVLESCSALVQDPLLGLRLAELQHPEVFGCAVTLARAAPTFRIAIQSLVDYVPLSASPECQMELVVGKRMSELRWRTDTGLGDREQANYQGLLLVTKTLRMLAGEDFQPSYATLTFRIAPANVAPIQSRLRCRVMGGAAAHAVAFPTTLLDRPVATANNLLYTLLGGCLAHLRTASRHGFVEQVEAYVRKALASGRCVVNSCASDLGISTRTLQKRLNRVEIKFSHIVQNERIKLAKHALLYGHRTLDDIALQLGYSEQTSFGRAFKRKTGLTPQAFRLEHHGLVS